MKQYFYQDWVSRNAKKPSKEILYGGVFNGAMLLFCMLVASCSGSNDSYTYSDASGNIRTVSEPLRERTPAELEAELLAAEISLPLNYLSVNYSLRQNLIDETVIEGTINNSARMASYQDVVLVISFESETGTELSTSEHIVYKFVNPSGSIPFKIKTYSPKSTRKIGVTVKRAKPVQ